ncbi:hypothetical protein BD310DRAFT_831880 [Dichomitus squalens]|uniref:Uncharacterized protein n=1 Tax=Dichomitus squalens TaxID=114155 RepID=A0A4Q9PH09_9APHY|nr:hypothetical protein BD310DRAFT_831880 [Dichomitus squalens]
MTFLGRSLLLRQNWAPSSSQESDPLVGYQDGQHRSIYALIKTTYRAPPLGCDAIRSAGLPTTIIDGQLPIVARAQPSVFHVS